MIGHSNGYAFAEKWGIKAAVWSGMVWCCAATRPERAHKFMLLYGLFSIKFLVFFFLFFFSAPFVYIIFGIFPQSDWITFRSYTLGTHRTLFGKNSISHFHRSEIGGMINWWAAAFAKEPFSMDGRTLTPRFRNIVKYRKGYSTVLASTSCRGSTVLHLRYRTLIRSD